MKDLSFSALDNNNGGAFLLHLRLHRAVVVVVVVLNTARSGGSIKELFVLIADNTELMAVAADGGSDEKIFTFVISTEEGSGREGGMQPKQMELLDKDGLWGRYGVARRWHK